MRIQKMAEQLYLHHEGRLCCSGRLHDKIEQLPPYFGWALSNSRDTWNAHGATIGASMMLLELQKLCQTGHRTRINADVAPAVL